MHLAYEEWRANRPALAPQLLAECPADVRRWEWHYLRRLFRGGLLHLDGGRCVAYSPDGRTLASGREDKTVKLWDVATGRNTASLTGYADCVRSLAFSLDGKTLPSAGCDRAIKLWDVASVEKAGN